MTDRELIELAAKAAGIELLPEIDWNPLESGEVAFWLAVKLCLCIEIGKGRVEVRDSQNRCQLVDSRDEKSIYAATRRAITRAAAEIGKEMGK